MNEKLKVIGVIIAYNSTFELKRLLDGIINQSYKVEELIIIENSTNKEIRKENKELIDKYNTLTTYIESNENYGSAKGFNIGMKQAIKKGAEFIWLLDQDGLPRKNCLENLVKLKDYGDVICPVVKEYETEKELDYFRLKVNKIGRTYAYSSNKEFYEVDCFGTNGALISKKCVQQIGYYDYEHFFVGGEDTEYSFRLKNKNMRIINVNKAIIYHPDLYKKHNYKTSSFLKPLKKLKLQLLTPNNQGYIGTKNNRDIKVNSYIVGKYNSYFYIIYFLLYSTFNTTMNKVIKFNQVKYKETVFEYFKYTIDGIKDRKKINLY